MVLERLAAAYPDSRLALDFDSPFHLLVALILAAQCTDERVNELTGRLLFAKYGGPADLVAVSLEELERDIFSTGFYRQKAKSLQAMSAAVLERFGGKVPDTLEDLLTLPGVGRKTANILLGNAFGKPAIGVDTHVKRLAHRLGWSSAADPDRVEDDLNRVVPVPDRARFCHLLQTHGRMVCAARKPACPSCVLADLCPHEPKTRPPASEPSPRPAFGGPPRRSSRRPVSR